ncbi:hypothetical protein ACFC08_28745 [Streptomyces sp. NPDC056112]|uniref:hypothetical protein n=1 Tax=Streptomyces sp. NPDC056112 TaxID=3345715 RepID=UPI0035DAA083
MDLDRTPAQISSAMAEEARALNHRTLKPDAFPNPSNVADTAVGIATVVQRLPQALQQLEAGLQALYDDKRIRLADRHPREVSASDIHHAVCDALFGLEEARRALAGVEGHLRSATSVLGNLGAPWEDEGEAGG